jgi:hypothetical protein
MKDAKGHGSNPHGAHAMGIEQVGKPWYHGSPKADQILKQGFKLNSVGKGSGYRGVMGVGVNITDNPARAAGFGKVLTVGLAPGVKMFHTKDPIGDLYSDDTDYGDPDKITKVYAAKGYDGIVITGRGGHQEATIFDPRNVRVQK